MMHTQGLTLKGRLHIRLPTDERFLCAQIKSRFNTCGYLQDFVSSQPIVVQISAFTSVRWKLETFGV